MKYLLIFVVPLLLAGHVAAATIDYSTIIARGSELDGKSIIVTDGMQGPAHVVIEPGVALTGLSVGGNSSVVMMGGSIDADVNVHTYASFTMLDGDVGGLSASGPVQLYITGGSVAGLVMIRATRNTPGLPQANISGGAFGGNVVVGAGRLLITDGSFQQIQPESHGTVEITGGKMTRINSFGESVVHYSGGEITGDFDITAISGTIHVYGSNLVHQRHALRLDGVLADGTVIENYYVSPSGARLVLHNVPEPSTLALALTICFAIFLGLRRHGCHAGHSV